MNHVRRSLMSNLLAWTQRRGFHTSLHTTSFMIWKMLPICLYLSHFSAIRLREKKPQQFHNINFLKLLFGDSFCTNLMSAAFLLRVVKLSFDMVITHKPPFNWTVTESLTHHIWSKAISSRLHLQQCPNINKYALYCHSALAHPAYNSSTADMWRSGLFGGPEEWRLWLRAKNHISQSNTNRLEMVLKSA